MEQRHLQIMAGTPVAWGLGNHARVLPDVEFLRWFDHHRAGTEGNLPLDFMMWARFALCRHSGTDFFAPCSQFFCQKFLHGICQYGAACNMRHEPYAEVCCADWLVYGECSSGKNCQFYHREPEGEALSVLSRHITIEEFAMAAGEGRRRIRYWP